MKIILNLIVIFLFINITCAQNILKGKVTDSETKECLIGVNIYMPELNMGTITDINGNYLL
ncbi:MAG: carboxypeptidase-like regulatory domain-containing protein [Bacteroidetes bacterium]|nr:carboxypeptidase-like regulatory domain-containing protein [Bacteroidota bacterium]